jgi:hypothetical protein
MAEIKSPDCGDNSCLYAMSYQKTGMRTNGGCRCEKAEGMQVHSAEARLGWYYTRTAMRLGLRGMRARDYRIAALESEKAALDHRVEELEKLLGEARLAMMEPYGEWKDVRENKVIVKIREALGVNFWPPRRTLVVGEEG